MRKLQICATICAKLLSDSRLHFANSLALSLPLPLSLSLSLLLCLHLQYLLHERSAKINVQMGRIKGDAEVCVVWSLHSLKSICASQKVLASGAFKTNLNDNYINVNVPRPAAQTPPSAHACPLDTHLHLRLVSAFAFFRHFGTQLLYELLQLLLLLF